MSTSWRHRKIRMMHRKLPFKFPMPSFKMKSHTCIDDVITFQWLPKYWDLAFIFIWGKGLSLWTLWRNRCCSNFLGVNSTKLYGNPPSLSFSAKSICAFRQDGATGIDICFLIKKKLKKQCFHTLSFTMLLIF